ncbi:MAG: YdcF family protein [Pelagimonas sp.]|nr:YdcF family protein [Pelagimonas sp.]
MRQHEIVFQSGMENPVDHSPVAVVLGARVWAGGQASPSLRRRAEHAAKLWLASRVRAIVACGGEGAMPPSEAEVIRQICLEAGVPEGAVFLEDQSRTTEENLLFARPVLDRVGARSIVIVTDPYHAPRARLIARKLGVSATSDCPKMPSVRLKFLLRETGAWILYFLRGNGARL